MFNIYYSYRYQRLQIPLVSLFLSFFFFLALGLSYVFFRREVSPCSSQLWPLLLNRSVSQWSKAGEHFGVL